MTAMDIGDPSTWPTIDWDDMDAWPTQPLHQWPIEWDIQAKVALIRHFSQLPLTVEEHFRHGNTTWTLVMKDRSRTPFRQAGDILDYLDGFLDACEAMAEHWIYPRENRENT